MFSVRFTAQGDRGQLFDVLLDVEIVAGHFREIDLPQLGVQLALAFFDGQFIVGRVDVHQHVARRHDVAYVVVDFDDAAFDLGRNGGLFQTGNVPTTSTTR